jgi:Zn-dependent protease with chaperone function
MAVGALLVVLGAAFVDLLVPHLPPSLEVRLFAPLAEELAGTQDQGGPGHHQASVGSLMARLSAHWVDNPYTFQVRTWADSTPNAFALPGGFIAVTPA